MHRIVSLDTLKFEVNASDVLALDLGKFFKRTEDQSGNKEYTHSPVRHNDIFGFSRLVCKPTADKLEMTLSAKFLGNNYAQGINLNTFDQFTETINASGFFKVEPDQLLKGKIHRIDPCETIEVNPYSPEDVVNAIHLLNQDKRYKFEPQQKTGYQIGYKSGRTTARLQIYAKLKELQLAKNRDFVKAHPKALNSFTEHSLRFEKQTTQHRTMREDLQIDHKEITLEDVLTSTGNPVFDFFTTIAADYEKLNVSETPELMPPRDWYKFTALRFWNYDLNACIADMKTQTGIKKPSRYKQDLNRLKAIHENAEDKQGKNAKIIELIKSKLQQ